MADSISFDFSGLTQLAADLGKVPDNIGPNLVKALAVTAGKMKKDWRESAKGNIRAGHARAYPYSISYDITSNAGADGKANEVVAEIGPDLAKAQGALGIIEEAPGGVRGTPQGNARKALANNARDFETGVLKAAADAIEHP